MTAPNPRASTEDTYYWQSDAVDALPENIEKKCFFIILMQNVFVGDPEAEAIANFW